MSAQDAQIGGDHYKGMAIQPVEFIHRNGIGFAAGCAIKYICRYRQKNGREDLEKAKHFLDLLIELEYPEPSALVPESVPESEPPSTSADLCAHIRALFPAVTTACASGPPIPGFWTENPDWADHCPTAVVLPWTPFALEFERFVEAMELEWREESQATEDSR